MKKLFLALTITFGVISIIFGMLFAGSVLITFIGKTKENISKTKSGIKLAKEKIKDTIIERF